MQSDEEVWGQLAYDNYRLSAGMKSLITGAELPEWPALLPGIKKAWMAAATAVVRRAIENEEKG